ncbi:tetratricopeptide repeat protein [Chloroflexi bacterium TSY]|nr:tetratricopeptide repeat protein [Chloroflexi bacterium TSY]
MSAAERKIFAQLSIFRGGFTREAAQAVTGASLRLLRTLSSKSLLQYNQAQDRYQVHELLRQHGAEQLVENSENEAAVRDRHSAYYTATLYEQEAKLKSVEQLNTLAEIATDIENIRLAWDRAVEQEQVEWIRQALESLGQFYDWYGRYREGLAGFEAAAIVLGTTNTPRVLARVLIWQARFNRMLGQTADAKQLLQRCLNQLASLELAEQDIWSEQAAALLGFGQLARDVGDFPEAKQLLDQSLVLFRSIDDRWGIAKVLVAMCEVVRNSGGLDTVDQRRQQYEQVEQLAQQSVTICREIGNQPELAEALAELAGQLYFLGRFDEAYLRIEACTEHCLSLDLKAALVSAYVWQGNILLAPGHYDRAQAAYQLTYELAHELGNSRRVAASLRGLGWVALVKERYPEAQHNLQQSVSILREVGDLHNLSIAVSYLGVAEYQLGEIDIAAQHLSEAFALALKLRAFIALWTALGTASLLLIGQGAINRAIEIYSLVLHFYFGDRVRCDLEDMIGKHIEAVAATLPPEAVAAAQERGRNLDLRATSEALLAEFEQEI